MPSRDVINKSKAGYNSIEHSELKESIMIED